MTQSESIDEAMAACAAARRELLRAVFCLEKAEPEGRKSDVFVEQRCNLRDIVAKIEGAVRELATIRSLVRYQERPDAVGHAARQAFREDVT